jgi:hypothetical protein
MNVVCPNCKCEMDIRAKNGVFRAYRIGDLEPLPAMTVEALENTALRVAERDEHGIGRGAWTSHIGCQYIVTVREGNPFVYKFVGPFGGERPMSREDFAANLHDAQHEEDE